MILLKQLDRLSRPARTTSRFDIPRRCPFPQLRTERSTGKVFGFGANESSEVNAARIIHGNSRWKVSVFLLLDSFDGLAKAFAAISSADG